MREVQYNDRFIRKGHTTLFISRDERIYQESSPIIQEEKYGMGSDVHAENHQLWRAAKEL